MTPLATTFSIVALVLLGAVSAAQPSATEAPTTIVEIAHPEVTSPPTFSEPEYHELVRRDGAFIAAHTTGFGNACEHTTSESFFPPLVLLD